MDKLDFRFKDEYPVYPRHLNIVVDKLNDVIENGVEGSGGSYDDSDILRRLWQLENRQDNDTIYDDTNLTTAIAAVGAAAQSKCEELEQKINNIPVAESYDDTNLTTAIAAVGAAAQSKYEELESRLDNVITSDELVEILKDYNKEGSSGSDDYMNGYFDQKLKDYVLTATLLEKLNDYALATSLNSYYTKSDVDGKISALNLSNYATQSWVTQYITEHLDSDGSLTLQLDGYASKDYLFANYYSKGDIDGKLVNYSTKANVVSSLIDYVKKQDVYTKAEVLALIQDIQEGNVDLANYYTKSEVNALIPDVSNLASKTYVSNSLSNIYTKNEVQAYVTNAILNIEGGSGGSVSLDGYATEQWVINRGYLTSHQSLGNYYTKSEADNNYYKKAETMSKQAILDYVSGYFDATFDNVNFDDINLDNYLKKDVADATYAKLSDIPDLSEYAKLSDIPEAVDMSNYLPLSGGNLTSALGFTNTSGSGLYSIQSNGTNFYIKKNSASTSNNTSRIVFQNGSTTATLFEMYSGNIWTNGNVIAGYSNSGTVGTDKHYVSIYRSQNGGNTSVARQYVDYDTTDEMQWHLENLYSNTSVSSEMKLGVNGLKLRYSGNRTTATSGDWKTVVTEDVLDAKLGNIDTLLLNILGGE